MLHLEYGRGKKDLEMIKEKDAAKQIIVLGNKKDLLNEIQLNEVNSGLQKLGYQYAFCIGTRKDWEKISRIFVKPCSASCSSTSSIPGRP
jgi:hypothetical protein